LSLLWKEVVEQTFERQAEDKTNTGPKILSIMAKYPDDKIDAMRRQKDEELENYRKEIERSKRFANKQQAQNINQLSQ
jgi:fructose-1,6-bisphosphatase